MQNPSSDESLEVITTLAPVETRLAENPPSPRPQISAERGKEMPTRRRDLTAFIGEHDVPHGHQCIGNSDSYLASQVIRSNFGQNGVHRRLLTAADGVVAPLWRRRP